MLHGIKLIIKEIHQGENIDLYLTIVLAFSVALLGIFQIARFEIISGVILAMIGLMATSLLANRRSTSELKDTSLQLQQMIQQLQATLQQPPSVSDILDQGYPDFRERLATARAAYFLGAVLSTTVTRYSADIIRMLNRDAMIRLLISESSPEVYKMQTFRSAALPDNDFLLTTTQNTIKSIKSLKERANGTTSLQLRAMPYLPPYGMVIIEGMDNATRIYVRLLSFKTGAGEQPSFFVESKQDGEWFHFFRKQYEQMWVAANDISL